MTFPKVRKRGWNPDTHAVAGCRLENTIRPVQNKFFVRLICMAFVLPWLFSFEGLSQITETFTAGGTFTVPAGVTSVSVQCWGGGGAGGGVAGVNPGTRTGGGGAGGAYVLNTSLGVTPGAAIAITVGTGGTGVSQGNGNDGGNSSFGSLVTANGGEGGKVGNGVTPFGAGGSVTTGTNNGGAGANGANTYGGGGGGGAGTTGNGGNSTNQNGGTAGAGGGGVGANGPTGNGDVNGNNAAALSGGGSGARSTDNATNRTGGAGFRGQVIVSYTLPASPRTYYSRANGNWNTPATWSLSSHTGTAIDALGIPAPGATDNILIGAGHDVTIPQNVSVQAGSVTVSDDNVASTNLFIGNNTTSDNPATLTISGNLIVNTGGIVRLGASTNQGARTAVLNVVDITLNGTGELQLGNTNSAGSVAAPTSTVNASGNIALNGTSFLRIGNTNNNNSFSSFTCAGTATIASGATLMSRSDGGGTHTLNFQSSVTNDGTINFATDNVSLSFSGAGDKTISGSGIFTFTTLTNLTLNTTGGANVIVDAASSINLTVSGTLAFSADGLLVLGSNSNVTLGNTTNGAATPTITGASPTRYIQLDGTTGNNSNLIAIRSGGTTSRPWMTDFPIGTSVGGYTPVTFSYTTNPTSGATLSVKPIVTSDFTGRLKRNFRLIVAGNGNNTYISNATFSYNDLTDISSGDTEAGYSIVLKNQTGVWSVVTGSVDFTANTFSLSGGSFATTPLANNTYLYTITGRRVWYSYQTGDFDNENTWTLDPSGTTFDNGLNLFPASGDEIHILNGRTVTVNLSDNTLGATEIRSGGTLDMANSTGNNLGVIMGAGLLKVRGTALPTGTYTDFVATTGGTIEYYDVAGTLSTTQTEYNKLRMTNSTGADIIFTLAGNLTVNGTFDLITTAGAVTWQINGNGGAHNIQRTITLFGDLTVASGGRITAGTGNPANAHNLIMYGNFTNNGIVRFGDPTNAPFNDSPTSENVLTAALTGRAVNVTFSGTTDQTVTLNNQTDFYRFIVDKGSTQQPIVTVNSSGANNLRLFGPADLSSTNSGSPNGAGYSNCALSIRNGTLQLIGTLTIPTLIEKGGFAAGQDFFTIPQTGALWLNSPNVSVILTSDVTGDNDDERLLVNGLFRVSNGSTFNGGHSRGIGAGTGGSTIIEGANTIVTIAQYRPIFGGSGIISYSQSGGTLNVGTTGYNGTPNTTPLVDDGFTGITSQYARFSLGNINSSFTMSDGIINIGSPTSAATGGGALAGGLDIQCTSGNFNVSGGTINMYIPQAATVSPASGSSNFSIYSTAELYNVNIYRVGTTGATFTAILNRELTVLNNLTIITGNTPTLNCNGNNLAIGGNFEIQANTTFAPGSGTITFNGAGAQNWTRSGTISAVLPTIVVDKTGILTVQNALGQSITNLTLTNGTLADNGNTLTVTGTLTNNATHTSAMGGSITYPVVNGTIGGNNGTFGNLILTGANSVTSTSGKQTVTGNLQLNGTTKSVLNISIHNLTVDGIISTSQNGGTLNANWCILTNGQHNDGGLTLKGKIGDILFPVGTIAVSDGTTVYYTPNTINVTATTHGKLTVSPVKFAHPNVILTNQSLKYYWNIISSGYVDITAVTHKDYTFSNNTLVTGDATQKANYRVARYDRVANNYNYYNAIFDATSATAISPASFNTGINWIGGTIPITEDKLDGEYTCGFAGAFDNLKVFYSKISPGTWEVASSWSNNSDRSGTAATSPCVTCPVIIGDGSSINHTITITANNATCGSLVLNSGSILNCGTNTGLSLGTNTSGTGTLRVAAVNAGVGVFPTGDFITFLGVNGGTVEWYGATKTLPTSYTAPAPNGAIQNLMSYHNLVLNPDNGAIITLPPFLGGLTGTLSQASENFANITNNTYNNVAPNSTTGSGTGALFTIIINGNNVTSITITTPGSGYKAGDQITFNASSFAGGGRTGSAIYNIGVSNIAGVSNFTIYNNLTQGESTFGTYAGTVVTNGQGFISVANNMKVNAGIFNFAHIPDNGAATTLTVTGNIINNGTFSTAATTANNQRNTHTITVSGGITNEGTMNLRNNTSGTRYNVADITFTGTNPATFGGAGTTTLNLVTINKGVNQTPVVTLNASGTLNTTAVANGWLTLTNGTFDFEYTGPTPITTLSTTLYAIPSSAKLKVGSGTLRITSGSGGTNDLALIGTLEVSGGTVYTNTTTANGSDNDIVYAATGIPSIIVSGGSLSVDGAIRRSTSTLTGALSYNQTSGVVTVGGNNPNNTRGIFEIDANTGSSFTLAGTSELNIYRQNGGTGFASLYINPLTSNVSSTSKITVGLGSLNSNPDFRVNIVPAIGNFTVAGGANAQTVMLYNNLVAGGDLTITFPSVLNATVPNPDANVTIAGDFDCTGTYTSGTNTTTFNGASAQSAVLTSTTDFYNVTVNKPSGTLTVSGTAPALPGLNNLSILSGTLEVGNAGTPLNSTLKVNRDIIINGQQTGTQSVEVYSTTGISNTITSSGGSFTNLILGGDDASARTVNVSGNLGINGTLTFNINRYLMMGSNRLTFGPAAAVSGSGSTAFVRTNGVSSDLGVVKNWTNSGTFIYPVGTSSNYTPVSYSLTVSTPGTITVIPVSSVHLTYNQASSERILNYYWTVKRSSSLIASAFGTHTYSFPSSLISGSGGTLVAGYLDANSNPLGWTTDPPTNHGGSVNTGVTPYRMEYLSTPATNIPPHDATKETSYDYSVGTPGASGTLPNPILPLYSRLGTPAVKIINGGGNWTTNGNWTFETDGDPNASEAAYSSAFSGPRGVPVVILPGAQINMNQNGRTAYKTTIQSTVPDNGVLFIGATTGHNLGIVEGTGTLRVVTTPLPAGNYSAFVSSLGGTVEYVAPMTMDGMDTYNNLSIYSTPAGTVSMTASNLTINGTVTIPVGTTLDNSVNNASMSIARNWINNGTFNAGTGSATVTFNGTVLQNTTGATTFNNLTINKTNNLSLGATTTVNGVLTLTSGNIVSNTFPTTPIFIMGSGSSLIGGSASSFVSGQIRKSMDVALTTAFTFPTGSNAPSRYRPVGISNTSANGLWDVSYFPNNPTADGFPNLSFNSANIVEVSEHEYWQVSRTGAATAALTLSFGPGSYATGGNAGILSSLRTARWTGSQWDLPPGAGGVIGAGTFSQTGDNLSGTVSFSAQSSFSPQTLATLDLNSALPIELISFKGNVAGDVVQLVWETASELNNDFFTVERSAGGEVFSDIGRVNGSGTTNQGKTYSLIDHNPIYGTAYYRLKQTDFDGTFTYSKIIPLMYEGSSIPVMDVYPNPTAGDQLNITISGLKDIESVPVVMYDQMGRECMRLSLIVDKSSGTAYKSFTPQESLPKGIYVLKAGASPMLMKRFVVTSK